VCVGGGGGGGGPSINVCVWEGEEGRGGKCGEWG